MSLEPSVHARTHAGWTRNSWRGRRRTVTATCVEARREERRKEEEEEEKGRERYKLSRSHVGIPVRPRRNNIQNWKERIRGIHSTNSLERRRGRGENLFLSRVLTAEVNPLGVRDACSGSKRDLSRETDRWTDFVLLEPRKYLEILERYGKIKVRPNSSSKDCPIVQRWWSVKRLRFDFKTFELVGKKAARNCRRERNRDENCSFDSFSLSRWRNEERIRKNFVCSVLMIRLRNRRIYDRPR